MSTNWWFIVDFDNTRTQIKIEQCINW